MAYSQTDRPIRVETTLAPDTLLLEGFRGTEEMSQPYLFELDLLSEDSSLVLEDLLRKPMLVSVLMEGGAERKIHGLVRSFAERGRRDDLTFYQAEIVPWCWFLSLNRDIKIFQEMSVLDIVNKVFDDAGYTDYRVECGKSYPVREYCVQYRESSLAFVARLLEEEGIFYFFEHAEGSHTMILADDFGAVKPCPGVSEARFRSEPLQDEDAVTEVVEREQVPVGKVTLSDYDYLQPSLNLESIAQEEATEEVFDYPGRYRDLGEGERLARVRLEERRSEQRTLQGEGSCRFMQAGCSFELTEHHRDRTNGEWVLLKVVHEARATEYRSWNDAAVDYRNSFRAVPIDVRYRPPRTTRRPVAWGDHTAVVVGMAGEEIFVDKHGRIKVQFYWDRDGKMDENSSCWVRVSTAWAGKGWGVIQIPRIGQEVIISFIDGDPDRPIVTGRVYNAEQVPPYALPANMTQSGVKSRSTKKGGTGNFNEIRMEDALGKEVLYIHAEKDKEVVVENDRTEKVGNDESIEIVRHRKEVVGENETIQIGGDRTESVEGDESIEIGGQRTEEIGNDLYITVDDDREVKLGGDDSLKVVGKRTTNVGKDDALTVAKKLTIKAGTEIRLVTGQASILMKKDGSITIKGVKVMVDAKAKVDIKASGPVGIKGAIVKNN